ncbi:hypothetical protein BH23GEM6_BH23GEM6_18420 [soil metagenome]
MAEHNQQVMQLVVDELEKDPAAGLEFLYERAKSVDPSIGELSLRQFHARYPLQVKRRRSRAAGRQKASSPRKKKQSETSEEKRKAPRVRKQRQHSASDPGGQTLNREEVRALFIEFAMDFASAESRIEIVRAISSVDSYVDRLSKLVDR